MLEGPISCTGSHGKAFDSQSFYKYFGTHMYT